MPYIMKIINTSHLFDINKKINSLEKCMHFTAAVNKSLTSIIIPHFQEVPNSKKMGKKKYFSFAVSGNELPPWMEYWSIAGYP